MDAFVSAVVLGANVIGNSAVDAHVPIFNTVDLKGNRVKADSDSFKGTTWDVISATVEFIQKVARSNLHEILFQTVGGL